MNKIDSVSKQRLREIIARHGYINTLEFLAKEAECDGRVSGSELASRLNGLLDNFSYGEPLEADES